MPKVFILNFSAHDFTEAENYGELVYLSSGKMNRYNVNNMHREFFEHLKDSSPDDWLLPTGLAVMGMVAAAMFSHIHGRLNLLLFKDGRYVERKLVFPELERKLVLR